MEVWLGYGEAPACGGARRSPRPAAAAEPAAAAAWEDLLAAALAVPVGSASLATRLAGVRSVCVLVPDETRKDVAARLVPLLRPHLGDRAVSVGVAAGKHPVRPPPPGCWRHDAHDPGLVEVGMTAAGTRVAYPRAVLDADLRIVVGEIRPHYFAGYAGGYKGVFPGAAGAAGIWHNHALKAAPGAWLGEVDANPCRADLEEAGALAGPAFLINVIRGSHGAPVALVAGDPVAAHRAGVARARPVFEVPGPGRRFSHVVVSDGAPVAANLYQACKLLAPAAALLAPGGTVVLAAACFEGIGPVRTINEAIYGLGLAPRLSPGHRVVLVSDQAPAAVAPTFAAWAPSVEAALDGVAGREVAVLPRAGDLVVAQPAG
ncbi:MAG: lactate racemase domain-containing protein [bacterium]